MSDRTEEIRARVEKEAEELVGFHLEGGEVVYDNGNYYHADPNHQALWDAMLIKLAELQKVAADRNRYIQRAGNAEGRLEVVEAELTALRQEVTRLTKALAAADAYFPAAALEVVNLRQENERLKGALEEIKQETQRQRLPITSAIHEMADAALSSSPAQLKGDDWQFLGYSQG